MLYFICCSRNTELLRREYTVMDDVCLGKTGIKSKRKRK